MTKPIIYYQRDSGTGLNHAIYVLPHNQEVANKVTNIWNCVCCPCYTLGNIFKNPKINYLSLLATNITTFCGWPLGSGLSSVFYAIGNSLIFTLPLTIREKWERKMYIASCLILELAPGIYFLQEPEAYKEFAGFCLLSGFLAHSAYELKNYNYEKKLMRDLRDQS